MKFLKSLFIIIIIISIVIWLICWLFSYKKFPVEYGISFNQNHAEDLDLDWKEVYNDILNDLHPKHIRIAAMWSEIESQKGEYNFADVDWMMDKAGVNGTKVVLVVGQKAPRWPECHVPSWFKEDGASDSAVHLINYVTATVERYKDHPALDLWQVENEPYIGFKFGDCEGYQENLVGDEINLVRKLDPKHKIVLTDSGELATWHQASKYSDILGTTLYRIVRTPGGKVFSYNWLPSGFYRLKARFWKKDYDHFFVSELQAEPWFNGIAPIDTPLEEMEKTMNVERLQNNMDYAETVGASRIYLWGVEWWYFMRKNFDDARYWEIVKKRIEENQKISS
ncbi:MAG: hypothetical protein COX81_00365 [Candidatus Magasanikbacteria bacterium CG_4_10_14_0_2_um_filter_37_12]|uniref:Glycoside hydrolase family 42 N-terminal domain-containing protein n=1 Tax=Candidatus Magasanikbacteria bacterium CG_4_10_14_0_2_um_filter_37_12 TaxID=1974637 RepID=A0A2M7V9W3_9BACT|nr:MAG: hypothetical protein COX81_00365 [Candidatus Magasanikbacteria bacterium CG_4_10_14_0_2_um_filter_37_12]